MGVDLKKTRDELYEEYENLLQKRDQLEREAGSLQISYTKTFGELLNAVFEKKIECIRKKKEIAYYQAALNHGKSVDPDELDRIMEKEMASYNHDLQKMLSDYKIAMDSKTIGSVDMLRAKKLYRRIAKRIHPDINPWTSGRMELLDLWQRTVIAYHTGNVKELEEVEVLAKKTMETLGLDSFEIEIPDIEEKIDRVEREINEILTTEPYTYEKLLNDPDMVQKKKDDLNRELEEYKSYAEELDEALRQLIAADGVSMLWKVQDHDN